MGNSGELAAAGGEPGRGKKWRWILIAGSAIATVVTAATIVIPIVADAQKRTSSADTLESEVRAGTSPTPVAAEPAPVAAVTVTAASVAPEPIQWLVPVDAPFDAYPPITADQTETCSPEQIAWLDQWGVRVENSDDGLKQRHIELRNTATDGAALSVRNLRAEGEWVEAPLRFEFTCMVYRGGVMPSAVTLTLGNESPAVYGDNPYVPSEQPPGNPFVQNLAPGETAQIQLTIDGQEEARDFVGAIVADVVAGTSSSKVTFEEGMLHTSSVLSPIRAMQDGAAGPVTISCRDGAGGNEPCTVSELRELLVATHGGSAG